jgi:hypothetical protein
MKESAGEKLFGKVSPSQVSECLSHKLFQKLLTSGKKCDILFLLNAMTKRSRFFLADRERAVGASP